MTKNNDTFDIIVIGAGHAGIEAAMAAARMGNSVALVTLRANKIGFMSCNPAIGGVGKGQLVKEIDALGGQMARAADACGIQFRILNASKGPAVWSSRAQIDSKKYCRYMCKLLKSQKNIYIKEAEVTRLVIKNKTVKGVQTSKGNLIKAKAVVITPGTFLNGLMHIGMKSFPGGRIEDKYASKHLSDFLKELGFKILRFKTGTCARLDGKTINFSKMRIQKGDSPPKPFSFSTPKLKTKQVSCFVTHTNSQTHDIIRRNLDSSPLFSGKIIGTGVRYCPSLEDKVVKFPHHLRHQIFLEPHGRSTDEFYPNGISTSLPEDIQRDFIHSILGLEKVKINRFGYGIEHDVIDSTQLYPTLETKLISNLYFAGQINGSTGYEEAAAQGLIAGINAALKIKRKHDLILDRSTSYIGVLIDDLVTKGTNEPYRMFTSRVEYRLVIREDNADLRLRKFGFKVGLVNKSLYNKVLKKKEAIARGIRYLKENKVVLNSKKISFYQLLKRPQVGLNDLLKDVASLRKAKPFKDKIKDILSGIEIEVKYSGFIKRQFAEVKDFQHLEKISIPDNINYAEIATLSLEIKEKLNFYRPLNLGQASRISGVTPAAITTLLIYLKKIKGKK